MKYGIFEVTRVTIPGDERSRTHPGHGYPEHTETYTTLHEFDDEESMKEWLASRARFRTHYMTDIRIIRFEELQVTERVEFDFGVKP